MIKNNFYLPYGKIQGINNIEIQIKREKYELNYIQEKKRRHTKKFHIKNRDIVYKQQVFLSPTEVYLNYIGNDKEFIQALSINAHEIYETKEDILGKNLDTAI
ncbi:hypothetical protein [Clostridium formicaceticum]|nr:hypothetical protein [Clostridium formicaceticum]